MRTSILAGLIVATALVPASAMAQRGDGNWQRGGPQAEGRARPERQPGFQQQVPVRQQPDRPDRPDRAPRPDRGGSTDWGGVGRPDRVVSVPQAPGRPSGDRGWRDDYRGNDPRATGNRGGLDGGRAQGDRARWQGDGQRREGGWRGDDGRGNQWRGNDGRNDARNGHGNWNRGWRQDNRYDWGRRRQVNRNAFHLPRYYAPSGWNSGYRRFGVGFHLSSGLFAQNYWIGDADYYGLPDAYGPYRWVRYYNDALLVDVYSGQVVDTVYDIFW